MKKSLLQPKCADICKRNVSFSLNGRAPQSRYIFHAALDGNPNFQQQPKECNWVDQYFPALFHISFSMQNSLVRS